MPPASCLPARLAQYLHVVVVVTFLPHTSKPPGGGGGDLAAITTVPLGWAVRGKRALEEKEEADSSSLAGGENSIESKDGR